MTSMGSKDLSATSSDRFFMVFHRLYSCNAIGTQARTARITRTAMKILRAILMTWASSLKKPSIPLLSEQNVSCSFCGTGRTLRSKV